MTDAVRDTAVSGDRPNRFPWPPFLLSGITALALAVDYWIVPLPVPFAETAAAKVLGMLLLGSGLGLVAWAVLAFHRHATSIRPDRASKVLMTSGPFALTRNPIYLGEAAALLGAGMLFDRLSLVLAAAAFLVAVTFLAVRGEEAHLARRFGDAYEQYCQRAGRWL